MSRLIFLLFTLLHTKLAISVLVPSHSFPSGGYIYNRPSSSLKPFSYPNPFQIQSPLFHRTLSTSHLSLPQSLPSHIHHNLPPAFLDNFLHPEDDIYYADDGRLLKQYEVMERIIGDLQHPENFLNSSPFLLDSFLARLGQSNFYGLGPKPSFIQPVTKHHGPVAFGSGGLGYIRLNNGAAFLGSGSLGYVSGQDASQAIVDAKTRKGLTPPGPLHFGHGFDD